MDNIGQQWTTMDKNGSQLATIGGAICIFGAVFHLFNGAKTMIGFSSEASNAKQKISRKASRAAEEF